jgi:hypothetical protein
MGAGALSKLSPEELVLWEKTDSEITQILDRLRFTGFEEALKGCRLLTACPLHDIIAVKARWYWELLVGSSL